MMKKTFFYFLASALLLLGSCSDNNNDTDTDNPPGPSVPTSEILNISINGVDYELDEFDNSLVIYDAGGMMAHRMDLRFLIDSLMMDIVIGNYAFQSPPEEGIVEKMYDTNTASGSGPNTECQASNGITFCDDAGVFYDTGFITYLTDEVESSDYYVNITNCNPVAHKVSGNFDVMLLNWFDDDTLHCVGTFENLEYIVIQ